MPVSVRIISKRDIETILELNKARHGERTRAIHADLPVMIHGHKRESRVEIRIHDRDIETVALGQRFPVTKGRAAQRINADFYTCGTNRFQINDVRQVLNVRHDEIFRMGCG